MSQSINLIPQEEQQAQQKTQIVRMSTIFSIFLLILVGGIAGYYFYLSNSMSSRLAAETANTEALRGEIKRLASIEIVARNLDKKYTTLKDIFNTREKYSLVLKDLKVRTPQSITVTDLSLAKDQTLAVSGDGTDYLAVSAFASYLTGENVAQSTEAEKYPELEKNKIFKAVSLNSVSLDAQKKNVNFFLVLSYIKEALTK
jgi:Tfp pilus assembly protein PilN